MRVCFSWYGPVLRVLLVSTNTEKINMPVLQLGLVCVAAATEEAGHEIKVVNLMDQQDSRQVLVEAVEDLRPEAVHFSAFNLMGKKDRRKSDGFRTEEKVHGTLGKIF